jgi:hypothetical protein
MECDDPSDPNLRISAGNRFSLWPRNPLEAIEAMGL